MNFLRLGELRRTEFTRQKIAWSRQDTVYMIAATIVNLLIVMSLLENLGIIYCFLP